MIIRTVEANGLPFEVYECGAGERLALCLHGFPEHAFSWRNQLPFLASLGYRAWAPNQRGYGKSFRPKKVSEYDLSHLMTDVAGLIDTSCAESVTLIGHDWGGIVAWFFAIRHVRPIDRLVIMNVPHPATSKSFKQMLRLWYMFLFQIPFLPEYILSRDRARLVRNIYLSTAKDRKNFPEVLLDVYRDNAADIDQARAMINWYRAALQGGLNRQRRLGMKKIEVPTLLLWGEEDPVLLKESSYGAEHYVSDLTLRYLPGVSHWTQEEAPELVNSMLQAFLNGQPVPESPALVGVR
ncbi:MAG: epoxide hydrolase [Candidatus Melainabacteria bacterium]|nr:MAG: epoxide hydrolase [Candidatus Melainabacteria bacterium]